MARQRRTPDPGLFPTAGAAPPPGAAPGGPAAGWTAALGAGLDEARARMEAMARSGQTLNEALAAQANRAGLLRGVWGTLAAGWQAAGRAADAMRDRADSLGRAQTGLALAYGAVNAGIMGWVRAGLAGTTAGERLHWQMTLLNREIAGAFLPVVERWIQGVRSAVEWFGRLSGEGQENIRRWSGAAAVFLGIATILPRLTGGVGGLGRSLAALAIGSPFTALAAGFVGLLTLTEHGRDTLSQMGAQLRQALASVAESVGGFIIGALENLSEMLSTVTGRFAALFLIVGAGVPGAVRAIQTLVSAFGSFPVAISAGLAAILLLAAGLQSAMNQWKKTVDEIAAGVRSGRLSQQEAEEQLQTQAKERAYKQFADVYAQRERFGVDPFAVFGTTAEEQEQATVKRDVERGRERLRQAGKGRAAVTPTAGAPEDPRQTLARVQAAAMRAGKPEEEKQTDLLKQIFDFMRQAAEAALKKPGNEGPRVGA